MKKISKLLLLATSALACGSVQAASKFFTTDPVTKYVTAASDIKQQAKDAVAKSNIDVPKILIDSVNVSALQNVVNDAKFINKTLIKPNLVSRFNISSDVVGTVSPIFNSGNYYPLSTLSGSLNGHTVNIYTLGGTALGNLTRTGNALASNNSVITPPGSAAGLSSLNNKIKVKLVDAVTGGKITKNTDQIKLQNPLADTAVLNIDGKRVLDSTQTLSREDALGLLRTLDILPGLNTAGSTNLGPMSPSGMTSQMFYDALTPRVQSHKETSATAKRTEGLNFSLADLKYEQVQFNKGGESGSIQGVLMAISTEVAGVEVGAYIPYDYLSFNSFDAHRTGGMLYAKHNWQLPMNLQLTTMADFSGIATYVTKFSLTGTVGGGVGTTLTYDDGGDFVPQASFAFQYSRDYYPVVGKYIKDNEQYLVKMGGSLGYRLFESGTLNAGFSYTRDITGYSSIFNKTKDNDFFDITVGGSYAIADTWQVSLNYKRILGLETYHTNAVFLGTSVGF